MLKKEVEVGKAICEICKYQSNEKTKVEPRVSFGGSFRNGKCYIGNIIFNYWHCPKHGSVSALLGKENIYKPLDLFKGKIAIYEAKEVSPAYSTTAEEFKNGMFKAKYKANDTKMI